MDARRHGADDLGRLARTPVGDAADDARHVVLVPVAVARVDALRREGDEHLEPGAQTALGERLRQQLPRGPHVGGAGEHDHLVAARVRNDRLARCPQEPQVRLHAVVDRRRDADHDRVRGLDCAGARREHELVQLQCGLQALPLSGREVDAALADVLQPPLAHVDPGHLRSPVRQADPRRQPDVAESQHRNGAQSDFLGRNPVAVARRSAVGAER